MISLQSRYCNKDHHMNHNNFMIVMICVEGRIWPRMKIICAHCKVAIELFCLEFDRFISEIFEVTKPAIWAVKFTT
jgi:hypothetical protein